MSYNTQDFIRLRNFTRLLLYEARITHEEYIELCKPLPMAVPYLDHVIIPKNMDLYKEWQKQELNDMLMQNMKEVRIKL